MLTTAIPDSSL